MLMPPIRIVETFAAVSINVGIPNTGPENCYESGKLAALADECHLGTLRCATDNYQSQIWLKCAQGGVIKQIDFAAFGLIQGDCEHGFSVVPHAYGPQAGQPECSSNATHEIIEQLCVGKSECRLNASASVVAGGVDPCPGHVKRLAVVASGCIPVDPFPPSPSPPKPTSETRWVFDFGQNVAGFTTLHLPAGHDIPEGYRIRIEHSEIVHEGATSSADTYNSYCLTSGAAGHPLRHEPCAPHPGSGHATPDRYVGDWNAANQTNEYVVGSPSKPTNYTPYFMYSGFRYAALTVHPPSSPIRQPVRANTSGSDAANRNATFDRKEYEFSWRPTLDTLTSNFVHTDVQPVGALKLAAVPAEGNGTFGTEDILNKIHRATRYSQLSNLFSVPTDW
jgi:hypothetical protein